MKRPVLRLAAVIGAATVSALAVSPAFARRHGSQATAQSIDLTIGGQHQPSAQKMTATNDGTTEARNRHRHRPDLVGVSSEQQRRSRPACSPQEAPPTATAPSFACAGVAGNGGQAWSPSATQSCDHAGSAVAIRRPGQPRPGQRTVRPRQPSPRALTAPEHSAEDGRWTAVVDSAFDRDHRHPPRQIGAHSGQPRRHRATCTANPACGHGRRATSSARPATATPSPSPSPRVAQTIVTLNLPVNPAPNRMSQWTCPAQQPPSSPGAQPGAAPGVPERDPSPPRHCSSEHADEHATERRDRRPDRRASTAPAADPATTSFTSR